MMDALAWLWNHPWVFWPLVSAVYLMVGFGISMTMYYIYCRHQHLEHGWKKGDKEFKQYHYYYSGPSSDPGCKDCWCNIEDGSPSIGGAYWFVLCISPLLWPLCGAVSLVVFLVFFARARILGFYERLERRACWDGKSVDNAHPTAREKTVDEEFEERAGRKPGSDIEII